MDQIGALGPGTVERLVLWAKDNRLRGSIDVRGDHSATLYFSAGFIAHIDDGEDAGLAASEDKQRVHARLARRLGDLLSFESGSYVINRSTELPPDARWLFGPQGLLDSALEPVNPAGGFTRWAGAIVDLDSTRVDGPCWFSADAVRLLVAMARSMDARELQAELGWPGDRVEEVLDELEQRQILADGVLPVRSLPAPPPPPAVVAPTPTPPSPPVAPPLDLRTPKAPPVAPTTAMDAAAAAEVAEVADRARRQAVPVEIGADGRPPAVPPEGRTRASALRRLIQNLR